MTKIPPPPIPATLVPLHHLGLYEIGQEYEAEVAWFDADRHYGFLIDTRGKRRIFVHRDDIDLPIESRYLHGAKSKYGAERVRFTYAVTTEGARAERVVPLDPSLPR